MHIQSKCDNNILEVQISGEIDHHSVRFIREEMDTLIERSRPDITYMNLSGVDFMDSSGLGLILGRYKKAQEAGGELRLVNPTSRVLKVLKLAGADKMVKIESGKEHRPS